jgi:hypothetical protein
MKIRIRRAVDELVTIVTWAIAIFVALWSVGAAAGVVVSGYCMVAGCR